MDIDKIVEIREWCHRELRDMPQEEIVEIAIVLRQFKQRRETGKPS
jgi:hypothetical protein